MIIVLIADNRELMRTGLKMILSGTEDIVAVMQWFKAVRSP